MIGFNLGQLSADEAKSWLFGNPFSQDSLAAYTNPQAEALGYAQAQALYNQIMAAPSTFGFNKNYVLLGILGVLLFAVLIKSSKS